MMGKFDEYSIQLKTMEIGESDFEYSLGNEYFEAIGEEAIQKGNVNARVHVVKTLRQSELSFTLEGKVVVPCDRCLEEMDQPIKATGRLIVRFGKEYKDDGDDIVIIPEDQGIINVSWFLYEFIELAIPIKHVHPFGHCNSGMASKLSQHLVDSESFEADTMFADDDDDNAMPQSADSSNDDGNVDPRWEALKKLKKD